jgi:hypothetical protein
MQQFAENQSKDFKLKPPHSQLEPGPADQPPITPSPSTAPPKTQPSGGGGPAGSAETTTAQQVPGTPAVATPPAREVGTTTPIKPTPKTGSEDYASNSMILAGAFILCVAIIAFFVRGALRSHLISHKAPLAAAGGAGWALFAFLMSFWGTLILAYAGNFWTVLVFILPATGLVIISFILFMMLYASAAKGRR